MSAAPVSGSRSVFSALRVALAISGALAIIAGLVILVWPGKSGMIVTGILATYLIVAGVVYLALGFFARTAGGWTRVGHILLGLVYIAGGIVAFTNLAAVTITLAAITAIFIGISWIVDGIVALTLLGDTSSRSWTILYAVVSIVGGVIVLFAPAFAALALWWILGTILLLLGIVQTLRAVTLTRDADKLKEAIAEDLGAV